MAAAGAAAAVAGAMPQLAASAAGDGGQLPVELRGTILTLESALHAISAAAKSIGTRHSAAVGRLLGETIPLAASIAAQLMSRGHGLGRGLLATMLVLVGVLSSWIGGQCAGDRVGEAAGAVHLIHSSLGVAEEDAAGVWPLRSEQDHSGAVALMKLAAAAPEVILAASPLEATVPALQAAAARSPDVRTGLSATSATCLLRALTSLAAHACVQDTAGAPAGARFASDAGARDALARALLTPPLDAVHLALQQLQAAAATTPLASLSAAASSPAAAARVGDGVRALHRLEFLLSNTPAALRPASIAMATPHLPMLGLLLGCELEGLCVAACDVVAALFDGCAATAAPVVPTLAVALLPAFGQRAVGAAAPLRSVCAMARCAAAAAAAATGSGEASAAGEALPAAATDLAARAVAELLVQVGDGVRAVLEGEVAAGEAGEEEEERRAGLVTEWLGVATADAAAGRRGCVAEGGEALQRGFAGVVLPVLPSLLGLVWRTLLVAPSAAVCETQQGMRGVRHSLGFSTPVITSVTTSETTSRTTSVTTGVRQSLLLLQTLLPPAPLGEALHTLMAKPLGAVCESVRPPAAAGAAAADAEPLGAAVLRTLILGVATWYPSWLLGDVVTCLWAMRHAHPDFPRWLQAALMTEGVPRAGLAAEQKAEYLGAMLEAKGKTHFKGVLKQATGGKKKNSAGTPQKEPQSQKR